MNVRYCAVVLIFALLFADIAITQEGVKELPTDIESVSLDNLGRLTQLARYGEGRFSGEPIWSPDGRLVAIPGTLGVWLFDISDFRNPTMLEHEAQVNDVAWSPDGKLLITITGKELQFRNSGDFVILDTLPIGGYDIAFSPDGRLVAVSSEVTFGGFRFNPMFEIIKLDTKEEIAFIAGEQYSHGKVFFTADGRYIVTFSDCIYGEYCQYVESFEIFSIDDLPTSDKTLTGYPSGDVTIGDQAVPLTNSTITYINVDENGLALGSITLLDAASGEEVIIALDVGEIWQIAYSGTYLVVLAKQDERFKFHFVDPQSGEIVDTMDVPSLWQLGFMLEMTNSSLPTLRRKPSCSW